MRSLVAAKGGDFLKRKLIIIFIGVLCLLLAGRIWYSITFRETPLFKPGGEPLIGLMCIYEEKYGEIVSFYTTDIRVDKEKNDEIISLLSECTTIRSFDKTLGKTMNGLIYSFIVDDSLDGLDIYNIGISENVSYCHKKIGKAKEKAYILNFGEDFLPKMQSIAEEIMQQENDSSE